jgi:hypothetical protein
MHNCFLLLRLICGIRRLQQINKTKSVIEIFFKSCFQTTGTHIDSKWISNISRFPFAFIHFEHNSAIHTTKNVGYKQVVTTLSMRLQHV